MKRVLLIILIALLLVVTTSSVVSAETITPRATITDAEIDSFVQELCQLNAAGNKADIVNFIEGKFREALGEDEDISSDDSNVEKDLFGANEESFLNIVARINKDTSTKQIVIGAHYDVVKGEGAADNAVGVAALYATMKLLAGSISQLPYNITFVAFDGEEYGLLGSSYYVSSLSADELHNTLVMFNIDSIALGDHLYLMCENKHTTLANTILANSSDIVEKPYAKGTFGTYLDMMYGYGYGYYESIQGSDHTPFRLSGVPIALLFSGTYDKGWGYRESSDNSQVINTASDTYKNLVNSGVDFAGRVHTVAGAISSTILSADFTQVAENAQRELVNLNFWYNGWWVSLVILVILVILAVFTWLYYRKLQKKAILGTAEIKDTTVFDKPDADEIFSFDNNKKDTDIDDIFTFRK